MKTKTLLIIILTGIFIILLLNQTQPPTAQGKIISIQESTNYITIQINSTPEKIILFNQPANLNLKINQQIKIFGTKDFYKNESRIIANKILILEND